MQLTGQRNYVLLLLLLISIGAQGQRKIGIEVSELSDAMQQQAKPILILLSADWCGFCKMQKAQLQKNREFKAAADRFYFIELNTESTKEITFNAERYRYKSTGVSTGIHELAEMLAGKEGLALPSWVLLDKNYQLLLRYKGVLSPDELRQLSAAVAGL